MEAVKHVRVRAVVRGRVQGVYYRASCRERAVALDLAGWVRNRDDGTVELEAQGPPDAIDALIAWCHQGPALAVVRGVDTEPIALESGEGRFEVRH